MKREVQVPNLTRTQGIMGMPSSAPYGLNLACPLVPKVNEMFPMPPAVREMPKDAPGLDATARKENVERTATVQTGTGTQRGDW